MHGEPQMATVTGQDDFVADGNVFYTVISQPAVSTDAEYSGMDPGDVGLSNLDDESARIAVSTISGNTHEDGRTATFTVVLNSEPTADVEMALTSSNASEGTVNPTSLIFTSANWSTAQSATVTGQDDFMADGHVFYSIVTQAAATTDLSYNGLDPIDVSVINEDNDTFGVKVSAISDKTNEGGGTATFTMALDSQPTGDVTIGLTTSDASEGTVEPPSLIFTSANWSTAQTVTVTGQDDFLADGNVAYAIITQEAVSPDPFYDDFDPVDISVINADNDAAGIFMSAISAQTNEGGGTATFTMALDSQPTGDVTIGLTTSDASEGTVEPSSLTFTSANWSTAQTATVTGQDDFLADGNVAYAVITGNALSTDPYYDDFNPGDISVINADNDAAGIFMSAISAQTDEGGGTATFTMALDSQPTGDVTIGLTTSDASEGTVEPSSLTFTSANWSTAQTATVTGQDDFLADGNVAYAVITGNALSTDLYYDDFDPGNVQVTNTDNDTFGVRVSAISGETDEDGATATFTIALDSEPTADVTIALSSSDPTEGTITTASITLTPGNWSTPQTVTVTGQNDDIADGDIDYAITTATPVSTDGDYSGLDPGDVQVTNTDNDAFGVRVSAISADTDEAGAIATFTIALDSEPTADVTIALSSSNPTEGAVTPASITLTPGNWSTPQTVTVTGQDDAVVDGEIVYFILTQAAVSTDLHYNAFDAHDVRVINQDDDTANILVSVISGNTDETGVTATFSVVLDSEPSDDVTIDLASSDPGEGIPDKASLIFTSVNWATPQLEKLAFPRPSGVGLADLPCEPCCTGRTQITHSASI
jgi:large repetitive protein